MSSVELSKADNAGMFWLVTGIEIAMGLALVLVGIRMLGIV